MRNTPVLSLVFLPLELASEDLQWYDIVDSNYSISQGFFFLYFYSGNGETL